MGEQESMIKELTTESKVAGLKINYKKSKIITTTTNLQKIQTEKKEIEIVHGNKSPGSNHFFRK